MKRFERNKIKLEKSAEVATKWIGSTTSLLAHTILFIVAFVVPFLGIAFERMLLVLTTVVSLEAIYLAIFIQMSVNKNTADIEDIAEDVEDIAEDVEEIQEDVEEIEKDVDEIQKDVDNIQEDIEDIEEDEIEETKLDKEQQATLLSIQETLKKLSKEIENLKK